MFSHDAIDYSLKYLCAMYDLRRMVAEQVVLHEILDIVYRQMIGVRNIDHLNFTNP